MDEQNFGPNYTWLVVMSDLKTHWKVYATRKQILKLASDFIKETIELEFPFTYDSETLQRKCPEVLIYNVGTGESEVRKIKVKAVCTVELV